MTDQPVGQAWQGQSPTSQFPACSPTETGLLLELAERMTKFVVFKKTVSGYGAVHEITVELLNN